MKEILCKHFTSINIVERLTVHSLLKSYLSVTHRYGSKNNKERKRVDLPRRRKEQLCKEHNHQPQRRNTEKEQLQSGHCKKNLLNKNKNLR